MKNLIAVIFLSVVLFSCRSTRNMSLSVLEPAPVTLPSYIRNVGVINRSLPIEKGRVLDAVDKIFTLEGARLDKEGSVAGVSGLTNELTRNNRFAAVKRLEQPNLGNNTPGVYPSPIPWEEVERICRESQTDALFSLELFDTDSKISYSAQPVKLNTPLGRIPGIEQQATMLTMVKTGWRIYDPKARFILDEFAVARQLRYTARGINPLIAANALIGRKEAVMEVGTRAGQGYAYRIMPYWLRVSRDYYVRGSRSFKMARRKAETGNWHEAGTLWHEETTNSKRKVAGRACYNMAIISEIDGDLDAAIQWAQKSYEDYNNRLALTYVRMLQNRKFNNRILKDQQVEEVAGNKESDEAN